MSRFVGGKGGIEKKLLVAVVVVARGAARVDLVIVLRAHSALGRGSRFIVMVAMVYCDVLDAGLICSLVQKVKIDAMTMFRDSGASSEGGEPVAPSDHCT